MEPRRILVCVGPGVFGGALARSIKGSDEDDIMVLDSDDARIARTRWTAAIVGDSAPHRLDADVIIRLPDLDVAESQSATITVRGSQPEPVIIETPAQVRALLERVRHLS
jgi:hypothetical protein